MHCSFGEDSELGFYIKNDDANSSYSMESRILLINQSSPELSYKISKHPSNCCLAKETEGLKLGEKEGTAHFRDGTAEHCVSLL